jgi:hypothetical protein
MIINVPSKAGYNYNLLKPTFMSNPLGNLPGREVPVPVVLVYKFKIYSASQAKAVHVHAHSILLMNTPNLPDCPKYMECPILQERMADPVVAKDHHTYERTAIESWFDTCQGNTTSPLTRALISSEVTPNQSGTMHCPRCWWYWPTNARMSATRDKQYTMNYIPNAIKWTPSPPR